MVSILIINYNTSHLLLQCVDSIHKHVKGVDYEIIVADNNSSKEERQILRDDKRFVLLELNENLGFGKANNAAAKYAKGDYLLLLNPDTVLLNDAVTLLYHYLTAHQEVGICGGNLYDGNMLPTHSFHRLYPSLISEVDFAMGQIFRRLRYGKNAQFNNTSQPIEVAMITGADLMIRRNVWEQLYGFDPSFFMYGEDADLCLRCKVLGYKVVSVPKAHIKHLEGKSFLESESHCRRIIDGRFTFFQKHYSVYYNQLTNIINIVSLYIAVILCWISRKKMAATNYSQRLRIYKEYVKDSF